MHEKEVHDNLPRILMREILSTGQNSLVDSTLRQLLYQVNVTSNRIDLKGIDADELFFQEIDNRNNEFVASIFHHDQFKHDTPSLLGIYIYIHILIYMYIYIYIHTKI
jgi:hypothetical protein